MFSLRRIVPADNAGASGLMSLNVRYSEDGDPEEDNKSKYPTVGWCMCVGNLRYWTTTPVTEIISENEEQTKVSFKTGNSTYEWEKH